MGQKQRLINLLFCGLQNFDLAREVDKVLEFVSPNRTKWKVLTDRESDLHRNTPMHGENMAVKRKTRVGKKIKSNKHAQENPQMLQKHMLALFQQLVLKGFHERVLVEESQT